MYLKNTECDATDIEMLVNYKHMSEGMANTYYIISAKVIHSADGITVVFAMDTPMLRWHEIEVRASMLNPYMITADCFAIGKHIFKFTNDAIELLEFKLRRIAIYITQNLMLSGELS